jgi:hypothetical protein
MCLSCEQQAQRHLTQENVDLLAGYWDIAQVYCLKFGSVPVYHMSQLQV